MLSILHDTKLQCSLYGPCSLWLDTTWNAKDDPVSICYCSGSIPTVFPWSQAAMNNEMKPHALM